MPIALLFDLRTVLDLAEQAITATNPADGVAASPALCWVTGDGTYLTADPGHRRRVYATATDPAPLGWTRGWPASTPQARKPCRCTPRRAGR